MCISLQLFRDYSLSFFGGLLASLVVVFSLSHSGTFQTGVFYVYLFVLYFVGLAILSIGSKFVKK